MGANSISEQLRASGNNRIMRVQFIVSPTAIALVAGIVTKKSRVKASRCCYGVASTGTIDVRVSRDGTAPASGVGDRIVSDVFDTATAAGTVIESEPPATAAGQILDAGNVIFVLPSTTLTNLSGCAVEIEIEPLE